MTRTGKRLLFSPAKLLSIRFGFTILTVVLAHFFLVSCSPSDRTPGQWLRGETASTLPPDWTFTDNHKEIFVEVATPYLIPHSVTIWCAQVDGALFIGARDPDTKNWPGWMDKNRDIRLKIGDTLYAVRAMDLTDENVLGPLRVAYAKKYNLGDPASGLGQTVKYWSIAPRL